MQGHRNMSALQRARRVLSGVSAAFGRFRVRFRRTVRTVNHVLAVVTWVASLACLVSLTVITGFDHRVLDVFQLTEVLKVCRAVFVLNILCGYLQKGESLSRWARVVGNVLNVLMLLTLMPFVYPHPHSGVLQALDQLLLKHLWQYAIMALYALNNLSYGVMRLMGRRTNPAVMMAGSFAFFIMAGALVLMMPKCTYHGISFMDSLFVSTSAVCITGLTTVDIPATFTPLGQIALCVLFQIGALGVITFTSFFAIFFSGHQSIYSQLMIRDMVYSKTMNSLVPTLFYILMFTLSVEAAGAVAIWFTVPESLYTSPEQHAAIAIFHSLSAFCNVGFSNVEGGMANPAFMHGNQTIYIAMSVLLFAGGIGFPILVNFKDLVMSYWRRMWRWLLRRPRRFYPRHIVDLNTRVVLATTLTVLVIGSVAFFVLESGNTMRGMSIYERVVQSVFNSLIPRSGGYATVNPADFLNVTLLLVLLQMWVGGGSQSMAGGIKVNTLGAVLLNLRSIVQQRSGVQAFNRNIAYPSVRRAKAVVILSVITVTVFIVAVMLLEPQLPAKAVVFECVSATFSVGSSLGITADLGPAAKCVLCVAMFVGRGGLLSLLTGMFTLRRDVSAHLPSENLIIN